MRRASNINCAVFSRFQSLSHKINDMPSLLISGTKLVALLYTYSIKLMVAFGKDDHIKLPYSICGLTKRILLFYKVNQSCACS